MLLIANTTPDLLAKKIPSPSKRTRNGTNRFISEGKRLGSTKFVAGYIRPIYR